MSEVHIIFGITIISINLSFSYIARGYGGTNIITMGDGFSKFSINSYAITDLSGSYFVNYIFKDCYWSLIRLVPDDLFENLVI